MLNVLCVTDYFVPGFQGGGVIRTLDNMRHQLSGHLTMAVFSRDRDLGATEPYPGIKIDQWNDTPLGPIFYASPGWFGPRGLAKAMAGHEFGAVYLNSFFSPNGSIKMLRALGLLAPKTPILLAPRGEFSLGALAVKKQKKRIFLMFARLFGLYRTVYWQASNDHEAQDILRQFPHVGDRIFIAPDPVVAILQEHPNQSAPKVLGQANLAFISRITPKKNLVGLLRILATVRTEAALHIYGPKEDQAYWNDCEAVIAELPNNIIVTSHGTVLPKDVSATFAKHDLFAFPTHGENFGHVIFESLRAGTPVLLSDQTPWKSDPAGAVKVIPTAAQTLWRDAIEEVARQDQTDYDQIRPATLNYATIYAETDQSLQANLEMFQALLLNDDG